MESQSITQEETQEYINEVLKWISQGRSNTEIKKELVKYKFTSEESDQIIEYLRNKRKEEASKGVRSMIYGLLWAIGGGIVTLSTYSAVAETGGTYYITYGAIIYGVIQFFKGLSHWSEYK